MGFRAVLVLSNALSVLFLVWLASHRSSTAEYFGRYSARFMGLLLGCGAAVAGLGLVHVPFLYRKVYRIRKQILLLGVSLALGLGGLELAVRVLDPLGISYYEEAARAHLDKVADESLVFKYPPDFRATYCGVELATNRLGLRERPIVPKAPGEFRLLFLGDSVLMGWGVPVEATFCRRLEGLLGGALHGSSVRTINAGVVGYNTWQEARFLAGYGDALDPDIVVLLYVPNDIKVQRGPFDPHAERSLRGKSPPEAIRLLLGRSWLYRLVHHVVRFHGGSGGGGEDRVGRSSEGWRVSMDSLRSIARFCKDRRLPFVTFVWRRKVPTTVETELLQDVSRVGKEEGFPVCDVQPWWKDVEWTEVTNSVVDSHPGIRGHEILARGMSAFLLGTGVLQRGESAATSKDGASVEEGSAGGR